MVRGGTKLAMQVRLSQVPQSKQASNGLHNPCCLGQRGTKMGTYTLLSRRPRKWGGGAPNAH